MRTDGGYIRLYRRLWENSVFRNKQEAGVFAWMISAAQWRPATVPTAAGPVPLEVGELIITERQASEDFGLSKTSFHRLIKRLTDAQMVGPTPAQKRTKAWTKVGTIVRVLNYEQYQDVTMRSDERLDQGVDQGVDRKRTESGPSINMNKGKEVKEKDSLVDRPAAARPAGEEKNDKKPGKAQLDREFEEFWKRYPSRRRGGKQDARRRYETARRTETAEHVLRRLERYLNQKAGDEERFIALAAGFLHRGYCMDDDDEAPQPNGDWCDPGPDEPPPIESLSQRPLRETVH